MPRLTRERAQRASLVLAMTLGAVTAGTLVPRPAAAQAGREPSTRRAGEPSVRIGPVDTEAPLPWTGLGTLCIGRGLRFNNPYRLATPLGDTAESVSVAATYLDLGAALLLGRRNFRHGAAISGAVALQGIGQFVLTPSYLGAFGIGDALGLRGRVGVPIVVAPDTTLGLEAAFGSSVELAYGIGALIELVGDVFFGAATDTTSITTIPMLSLQVGVFFEHQVSP